MKETRLKAYEQIFVFISIIAIILTMTGCAAFVVESKTVIDYRYTPAHVETEVSDTKTISTYEPEKYELLWEYTYADGHTDRRWESCTRFEYQSAREDLGDIQED